MQHEYNQRLLKLVLARTKPETYTCLPPDPREIMRKGVLMHIATCADFVRPDAYISRDLYRRGG